MMHPRSNFDKRFRLLREVEDKSQPEPLSQVRVRLSESPEPESPLFEASKYGVRKETDTISGLCGRQAREQFPNAQNTNVEKKSQLPPPKKMRDRRPSIGPSPDFTHQQGNPNRTSPPTRKQEQSEMENSCMLLNSIPLELREEIFEYVLGTQATLHLVSRTNRVGHLWCPEKTLNPQAPYCGCAMTIDRASYVWSQEDRQRTKVSRIDLSLLQTCRQAYREGIHMLYSRPVFDIQHPETLNWLKLTVPRQRLSVITKLSIRLGEAEAFRMHEEQTHPFRIKEPRGRRARNDGDLLRYWDPAWRTILCDMHGLKHLTVTLGGYKYDDAEYAEPVLRPLLELRGLSTFKLQLRGWTHNEDEDATRLERLKENSETLRTILKMATRERTGMKRKADEMDWRKKPRPQRTTKRKMC